MHSAQVEKALPKRSQGKYWLVLGQRIQEVHLGNSNGNSNAEASYG